MIANPDSDVDAETDTEPDESGRSRSETRGGSPSATDMIRLYDRNRDRDTSPTNSVIGGGGRTYRVHFDVDEEWLIGFICTSIGR